AWNGDPDLGPTTSNGNPGIIGVGDAKLKGKGFGGGIQAGYNYQTGSIVWGLEADANYIHLRKSYTTDVFAGVDGGTYEADGSIRSNWLITLRPRIGVAFDRLLLYVTGGLAIANNHFDQDISFTNGGNGLPNTGGVTGHNAVSGSGSHLGWTLGGGVEWAFNNSWSLKAEYLYAGLGHHTLDSTFVQTVPETANYTLAHREHNSINLARLGLNYHF